MTNPPDFSQLLPSVDRVVSQSAHVIFHPDRIGPAVEQWGHLIEHGSSWEHPCHFFDGTEEAVKWIFTLDVLNHCFWPDPGEPVWTVFYKGIPYSGYWGLAASLKRAFEANYPITDPTYLSHIDEIDLSRIFSGQGCIPLFEERLRNLREAGTVLLNNFGGSVLSLLQTANGSAARLAAELAVSFPSFRDEAAYKGQTVYFWKRAQIFAWDLFSAFGGKNWGTLSDIGGLTAFADYKLPQVLRELGIISYTPELAAKVDNLVYLRAGSEEEVEIRAITIRSVEEIRKAFLRAGRGILSAEVDNWLWRLGQFDSFRNRPYHRCRTIFY